MIFVHNTTNNYKLGKKILLERFVKYFVNVERVLFAPSGVFITRPRLAEHCDIDLVQKCFGGHLLT